MSHEDIIRAWKDEEYRNSLSEEQRAQLPENPAGMNELSDETMQTIAGGLEVVQELRTRAVFTLGCCVVGSRRTRGC